MCILPVHSLTKSILGSQKELRRDEDNALFFKDLIDINPLLSLLVSEIGDQDKERIKERISEPIIEVLKYCQDPKSKDEIFGRIKLYKNTKNFNHHIKPLIEVGWLNLTLPNKPTSKNQQYYTTKLGEILLTVLSEENESKMKRIPIASSNIAAIGYNKEARILEIEFHHGAIYQYIDVPETVYEKLMSSPSQGAYYMNELKGKFKYQKK